MQFDTESNKIIKLESMKDMSIDQIVYLYKEGYIIENSSQIEELDELKDSERQRKYRFMRNTSVNKLPFEHTPPETYKRESKYAFMNDTTSDYPIPPSVQERWERQKRYGFTGQESQPLQSLQGISISSDALLLIGIGLVAYLYIKQK